MAFISETNKIRHYHLTSVTILHMLPHAFNFSQPSLKRNLFTSAIIPNIATKPVLSNSPNQIFSLLINIPAGSRYETNKNIGSAHLLKSCTFLSNQFDTRIAIAKEADLNAAHIGAFLDRERLGIYCCGPKRNLSKLVQILLGIAGNTQYLSNEYENAKQLALFDWKMYQRDPERLLQESLHHVAFRNGLGNFIYAEQHTIENLSKKSIEEFKRLSLEQMANSPEGMSSIIYGINEEEWKQVLNSEPVQSRLQNLLQPFASEQIASTEVKSKYFGGELRISMPSCDKNYFALGFPLPAIRTIDEWAKSMVIQELFQSSSAIPFSTRSHPIFQEKDVNVKLYFYSDTSLLTFVIPLMKGHNLHDQLQICIDELYSVSDGKFIDDSIDKSRRNSLFQFRNLSDNRIDFLTVMSKWQMLFGKLPSMNEIEVAFEKVTKNEVQESIKGMLRNRPSIVSLGQLNDIPFSDELKFNL